MANVDVIAFLRATLEGKVQPLTFVSVEDDPKPNWYKITLRVELSAVAHLPTAIRRRLEEYLRRQEDLVILFVWHEPSKRASLVMQTVQIPKLPGNREKTLEIANDHNKDAGNIAKMAIIDHGDHMVAGLSVTLHFPLVENRDIAGQILNSTLLQLTREAGNVATILVGGAQRDPNAPTH